MAKKDKKKKDKQKGSDAAEAVEAVRSAVERTFQATTEGAASTQKRTRALAEEIGHAAVRVRETLEDLRILEDVRGLRAEIEGLARRIAALEIRDGKRAPAAARPAPAKRAAAKSRAKRAPAKRTAKRSPAKRTAKRAPAKRTAKPSAKRAASSTTAKRAAKPRARSRAKARAKPSGSS